MAYFLSNRCYFNLIMSQIFNLYTSPTILVSIALDKSDPQTRTSRSKNAITAPTSVLVCRPLVTVACCVVSADHRASFLLERLEMCQSAALLISLLSNQRFKEQLSVCSGTQLLPLSQEWTVGADKGPYFSHCASICHRKPTVHQAFVQKSTKR